jgi:hypothetical protein
MGLSKLTLVIFGGAVLAWPQTGQLKTADAVLERYKEVLGGVEAIKKVQSETVHGEIEGSGMQGKTTFVHYGKPFKSLMKVTRPDGRESTFGFDGQTSWSLTPKGAEVDKDIIVEAERRDADLQYSLHQPDYFRNLDFAGVTDFEGRRCYWLHGTTHWGKDNNQFYDVETGLLAGYRYQADNAGSAVTITLFEDYKKFGGPLIATKTTTRSGDKFQTFTYRSVSYEPIADSVFDLPAAVKGVLK